MRLCAVSSPSNSPAGAARPCATCLPLRSGPLQVGDASGGSRFRWERLQPQLIRPTRVWIAAEAAPTSEPLEYGAPAALRWLHPAAFAIIRDPRRTPVPALSSGAVAQLGERRVRNAKVGSSILLRSTKCLRRKPDHKPHASQDARGFSLYGREL